MSQEVGEELARLVATPAWQEAAAGVDCGFGDVLVTAPRRTRAGKGRQGGGLQAPGSGFGAFGFIEGGAAPHGREPQPPVDAPPAAAKAPAPESSGWGDRLKAEPGERKCHECLVKNPRK